jgi:hypothetical protein
MSDMKCPFCQQELDQSNPQSIECRNDSCKKTYFMYGSAELWQELIRTKKQLGIVTKALEEIWSACDHTDDTWTGSVVKHTIEQITALEQKD